MPNVMVHTYRDSHDPRFKPSEVRHRQAHGYGIQAYAVQPRELTVQPGWPHGDVWGKIMHPNEPESHDEDRHREMLRRLAEKKGKTK